MSKRKPNKRKPLRSLTEVTVSYAPQLCDLNKVIIVLRADRMATADSYTDVCETVRHKNLKLGHFSASFFTCAQGINCRQCWHMFNGTLRRIARANIYATITVLDLMYPGDRNVRGLSAVIEKRRSVKIHTSVTTKNYKRLFHTIVTPGGDSRSDRRVVISDVTTPGT